MIRHDLADTFAGTLELLEVRNAPKGKKTVVLIYTDDFVNWFSAFDTVEKGKEAYHAVLKGLADSDGNAIKEATRDNCIFYEHPQIPWFFAETHGESFCIKGDFLKLKRGLMENRQKRRKEFFEKHYAKVFDPIKVPSLKSMLPKGYQSGK